MSRDHATPPLHERSLLPKEAPSVGVAATAGHVLLDGFRKQGLQSCYKTALGALFSGDCLEIMPAIRSRSVDTIFADPPFNIGKQYGGGFDDARNDRDYVAWCKTWLRQCIRVLKPGGAIFVYNLPRWNIVTGAFLMEKGLTFRHDIAIEMKNSLPIRGRLYPSHYSLLYFTKGSPKTFRNIRTPIPVCRHCGGEIPDYGGHRDKMNPLGVNLTDIWTDIPIVRHKKYKPTGRGANTLSTKMLDRIVEITTEPGDVVLDPFAGAGTTCAVAEKKARRWIAVELNDTAVIIDRLSGGIVNHHHNSDVIDAR